VHPLRRLPRVGVEGGTAGCVLHVDLEALVTYVTAQPGSCRYLLHLKIKFQKLDCIMDALGQAPTSVTRHL